MSLCGFFCIQFRLDSPIHSQRLAHTLHPIVVATFLDCAPAAFGLGSTNSTELELIASVANISRSIYSVILQGDLFVRLQPYSLASKVLSLVTGEFEERFERAECLAWSHGGLLPVLYKRGQARYQGTHGRSRCGLADPPPPQTEQTVQQLNLTFCELTSLLTLRHTEPLPSNPRLQNHKPKGKSIQKLTPVASLPLDRVSEYVSILLAGEANPEDGLSRPLTLAAYWTLLPTLWSLVNNLGQSSGGSVGEEVIKIVVNHAMRIGSTGASKRATVEFVGGLMLVRQFVVRSSPGDLESTPCLIAQNRTGVYRLVQV